MLLYCPHCHTSNGATSSSCSRCQGPLRMDGRYLLTSPPPSGHASDEVDGAMPIRAGLDVESNSKVAIRLAPLDMATRVDREATILRGLDLAAVPKVLAVFGVSGVGRALVMTHPAGQTLEEGLQ